MLGVGEAPGEDEDSNSRRPFTGASGKLLHGLLRQAGYQTRDVAFVNAVRCRPKRNATPTMRQLRACRPFLLRVIEQLQPRYVVAFGASAAKALLNRGSASVTALRGRVLEVRVMSLPSTVPDAGPVGEVLHPLPGLHELVSPLYVTYHPSAVLRGATHLKQRIIDDLVSLRQPNFRDLAFELPSGKVLAVDTEYDPDGTILTVALADAQRGFAWDVDDLGPASENDVASGA